MNLNFSSVEYRVKNIQDLFSLYSGGENNDFAFFFFPHVCCLNKTI